MGAEHKAQQTLADWPLPTGREMAYGHYVTEAAAIPPRENADEPGDWAQLVNNIYEIMKPPFVNDAPQVPFTATGGPFVEIARYRVPNEFVGTGLSGAGDVEELVPYVYALVSGGDTARLKIETPDTTVVETTWVNGALAWTKGSPTDITDSLTDGPPNPDPNFPDPEIIVKLRTDAAGTADVAALQIVWNTEGATLPDGPYDNEFRACNVASYADKLKGLSVPMMQRLAIDIDDLYRRRTPGMIIASFLPVAAVAGKGSGNSDQAWRAMSFRHPHVSAARVYVYAKGDATLNNSLTVSIGAVSVTLTALDDTAFAWHRFDFAFVPSPNTIPQEFTVTLDATTAQGCTGWYRAIQGLVN